MDLDQGVLLGQPRSGKDAPKLVIPVVPWHQIELRIRKHWVVRKNPHHSIIGQTGSGKSHLTRYGILATCEYDRVLFLDFKGDDETLRGFGHVVDHFPSKPMRSARKLMQEGRVGENWFRLVTSRRWDVAKDQVGEALERVMDEGDWIVVVDELRVTTDTREPGLNLAPQWEAIVLRGRSRGVGLVNSTQEPRWVRGSFYTQSQFYWISNVEDEAAQKRIAEIGSSRALLDYLPHIPPLWWIYTDKLDGTRFWALTQAPPASARR